MYLNGSEGVTMTKSKTEVDLKTLEVSTNQFANLVGKSSRWIRQLTSDGVLTQCGRGKYKLGENLMAYMSHAVGGNGDGKTSFADAKAEHEVLKKEKTELQLQQMRGQLHAAEDVRLLMGDMILSAKSKFLSLPTRISPQLEGESAKAIEKKLREEVTVTLNALVDYSPQLFKEEESSE